MTYDPSSGNGATATTTVNAATTLTAPTSDLIVEADSTTAAFQITLFPAAGFQFKIDLKRMNAGTGKNITIKANGTETIDGSTNAITLTTKNQSFTLTPNAAGNGWDIV